MSACISCFFGRVKLTFVDCPTNIFLPSLGHMGFPSTFLCLILQKCPKGPFPWNVEPCSSLLMGLVGHVSCYIVTYSLSPVAAAALSVWRLLFVGDCILLIANVRVSMAPAPDLSLGSISTSLASESSSVTVSTGCPLLGMVIVEEWAAALNFFRPR